LEKNKTGILNFENLYSVFLFNKNINFKKAISSPGNFIFSDGKILSIFLGLKQVRGPTFTRDFLENELKPKKKYFFILPKQEDLEQLIKKYPKLKNSEACSPAYIKGDTFSKEEVKKIVEQLKNFKPTHVWVCVGNPKQEILSNQLYKKHKALYFNVGAAIDFLLGKKKEAPKFWRAIGLEWFYRGVTDFKHSWKKILGSIIGMKYVKR